MSIIYIISIILLFIIVLTLKKSDKKLEIIKTVFLVLTLNVAYNVFVCYILNLINIPITLINLSIVNLLLAITCGIKIIRDKSIQKYYIEKKNVLVVVLMCIITVGVLYANFGNLTKIRYISMDGREHYKVAREFSENETLTNKQTENYTVGPTFMPAGYVNAGILLKIFKPYLGTVELYKIYILFESYIYLLASVMFYFTVNKINSKKSKINMMITIIFSIIYALGYLLNSWISGFHYLVIGILFITAILYVIGEIIEKNKLNRLSQIILIFLLNLGLIFSYCLFCPFVYLAEFIYFTYKYWKNEKIKLAILTLVVLIIPGIIGVIYLVFPNSTGVTNGMALEGYIYKNIWSNIIAFIPFTIYYFYYNIKNKKITIENIMLTLLIIFMIILFIGTKIGKCSEYYFYKNYYILWLLLIYSNINGMIKFSEKDSKKNVITLTYTVLYIIIFIISLITTDTFIKLESQDSSIMEIFTFNKTMMFSKNAEFVTKDELQLYKKVEELIDGKWKEHDNKILFATDGTQSHWIVSLTGYDDKLHEKTIEIIQRIKNNSYKYIVVSENREAYDTIKKYMNYEMLEKIYENNDQKIYMLKGE